MALFSCYRCGLHLWLHLRRQTAVTWGTVHLQSIKAQHMRSCHLSNIWQPFVTPVSTCTVWWELSRLHDNLTKWSLNWAEKTQVNYKVLMAQLHRLVCVPQVLSCGCVPCSDWLHLLLVILPFLLCFPVCWVCPICLCCDPKPLLCASSFWHSSICQPGLTMARTPQSGLEQSPIHQ